jgi:hypothetical protein
MFSFEISKGVTNINKLDGELRLLNPKYLSLSAKGERIELSFKTALSQTEVDAVSNHINSFVEYSVVEGLKSFLDLKIDVFVANWITKIRAENLQMGISIGSGMYEFQSVAEACLDVRATGRKVSLLGSLQTGTLSVSIEIMMFLRSHPEVYAPAAPYFSDERLAKWIVEFTDFLKSAR